MRLYRLALAAYVGYQSEDRDAYQENLKSLYEECGDFAKFCSVLIGVPLVMFSEFEFADESTDIARDLIARLALQEASI